MSTNFRNIFGTIIHDIPEGLSPIEFRNLYGTLVHSVPEGVSPIEFRNLYGTLVHTTASAAPASTSSVDAINLFSTVVHNSSPATATAINLYTSVVHNATPSTATAINLFSSVVHNTAQISGTVADITGTVNASASFDATSLGYSTSSVNFQWTWQSVPTGSSITNQVYPLPDNKVNTYFNMSDNKGLWHFEGNADDSSGDGRNGTPNNATLVAGKVGAQAYQFLDSDTSYIDFGQASDFLSTSSPFSVAIWIKGDSGYTPATYDAILGFSNAFGWTEGMGIYWNDATTIRGFIEHYNTEPVYGTITNVEEWNHIVMTYDQTDLKLYINGSLTQTQDRNITLNGLSNNLQVGRLGTHGRLEASLDEFAIWERTLSDLEVNNLYFLQSGSLATDLVGNVGLGDTFTFVPDVSGTFTTNLSVTDGASSLSGNINAVISPAPPGPIPVITGSNPTTELITANQIGYSINTYKNNLLSVQRARTVTQVPFKLGGKGIQSLRRRTNTEFTGSS